MPRGNLETVHPRALVLATVRKQLDGILYKDAFTCMRRHRINMNLIYDHDPDLFHEHVEQFIRQLNNVNHFNVFLADLSEEDVTKTMYPAAYGDRNQAVAITTDKQSKVNTVCDLMRKSMEDIDTKKFFLAILTTYVKKSPPELGEALTKIQKLQEAHRQDEVDEALKYLMMLVNVAELYQEALGTYNFDLVMLVAERSQMDPKEYLPFLNNLRAMDESYRKFSIDKHLKRHNKALNHISQAGDQHFPECLTFIKEHRLFTQGLLEFKRSSSQFKAIAACYADYLSQKNYHEEAGLMYLKAGQPEGALLAFERCADWQQCMSVAAMLKYTPTQTAELSKQLAKKLKEKGDHSAAAVVLEQYANDHEEAIITLIQGQQWFEAIRIMYKYQRTDFIETDLRPALTEQHMLTTQLITDQQNMFQRYYHRLSVVRAEKEKRRLEIIEGTDLGRPDTDLFSDTSSAAGDSVSSEEGGKVKTRKTGSIVTKASGSSRKSRRKAENRSKWSLREGSQHEDFALIEALSKLVAQAEGMKGELSNLLRALLLFDYDTEAAELQTVFESYTSLIDKSLPVIWNQEESAAGTSMSFGPDSTANAIAEALSKHGTLDAPRKLDPVLLHPPKLDSSLQWKLNSLSIS